MISSTKFIDLPVDLLNHILSFLTTDTPKKCYFGPEENGDGLQHWGNGRGAIRIDSRRRFAPADLRNFAAASRALYAIAFSHFKQHMPSLKPAPRNWSVAQDILERRFARDFAAWRRISKNIGKIRGDHLCLCASYNGQPPWNSGVDLRETNIQLIEEFLQNNRAHLGSLVISNRKMHTSMSRIANALQNNTTVSELIFPHNCITSEEALQLANALTHQTNSAIQRIDLSNPHATATWFPNLDPNFRDSIVLGLQFNQIDDIAATSLVEAVIVKPNFQELDLRGNRISQECAAALKARMEEAGKTLEI